MGYRELSRMEMVEVVRRWQMGESQRAIARASGVARETVKKYLRTAEELGLAANGPPPAEDQVVPLVQVGRVVSVWRVAGHRPAHPEADARVRGVQQARGFLLDPARVRRPKD